MCEYAGTSVITIFVIILIMVISSLCLSIMLDNSNVAHHLLNADSLTPIKVRCASFTEKPLIRINMITLKQTHNTAENIIHNTGL